MLIALTGYARAGKDTVGQILAERHGFGRVSFAERLKQIALDVDPILEIEPDLDTAPFKAKLSSIIDIYGGLEQAKELPAVRKLLQDLGVSARHRIGTDVWVNAAIDNMPAGDVVITDCRFQNEAAAVTRRGGFIVRVKRPGVQAVNSHISEHDLADWPVDADLFNTGTIEELAGFVEILLRMFRERGDSLAETSTSA